MGLFDSLKEQAEGLVGKVAGGNPAVAQEVMNMMPGGLQGLVQQFQAGGLGHIVQSWVGTGGNHPITADQIQQVLGNDKVKAIAAKFGIDPAQASQHLASMLPGLVDKLTPNGQLPAAPPAK